MHGRGRDCDPEDLNPLTAHIFGWFTDLNDSRKFTVVAGMGGGDCIPEALSHQELAAWANNTGNDPTAWEYEVLKGMDRFWRSGFSETQGKNRSSAAADGSEHQALGEYCRNEKIDECRKMLGAGLEQTCATCPN